MKKILYLTLLLMFSFVIAACSSGGKDGKIDTLFVYTNQTSGGRGAKLQKLVKQAGFDFNVEFVELSGQNLKNRLIAEKGAPIADVVLGGGIIEHIELKNEGVTKPYFPSWLETVDDVHKDKDGYFSPWAIEPLLLVYNKQYYTNNPDEVTGSVKLAPKDWVDLATNFKGKYNVFKPSSGTGSTIYASILSKYRDSKGDKGVSQEGWNLLSKLINGGELDRGLWQSNLAGSEYPISMTWAGAIFEIENAYDIELGIVEPAEGVPFVVSQIAVVNSKNKARENAAKEFIEWWGKTETQVAWSEISGQAPANKEAFNLVDEKIRELNNIKALELDWEFIAEKISDWRLKIELDIIGN